MKIAVVGAGYVGLVSGACFAEFGFEVVCIDKDPEKIRRLRLGEIPIHEPGLDTLVIASQRAGRLTFSDDLAAGVRGAHVVLIAVGTPTRRGEDAADLAFVKEAARQIALAMDGFTVVVTKSTVPVGTARMLETLIRNTRPDADFEVAANPEFLREGSAVEDFLRPDRVVVGVESERARERMERLYRPLMVRDVPVLFTGFETAEIIKYAANAFLATRIGFINEIADICEEVGADISAVTRGMGLDRRIGQHYLQPGPGFGGSCFPKDTRALVSISREAGAPSRIVESVVASNVFSRRLAISCPTSASACWASPSRPTPTTCARPPHLRWCRRFRRAAQRCKPTILWRCKPRRRCFRASPGAATPTKRSPGPMRPWC
jgi:UDPglucose 6-dehydrogenase